MYTALTVLLEQILCPRNYSNIFIGVVCGSGLVVAGVFGALIASKIADRTKRFELVAKITYVPCVGAFAAFVFLQVRSQFVFNLIFSQPSPVMCIKRVQLITIFLISLLEIKNQLIWHILFSYATTTIYTGRIIFQCTLH